MNKNKTDRLLTPLYNAKDFKVGEIVKFKARGFDYEGIILEINEQSAKVEYKSDFGAKVTRNIKYEKLRKSND